MQETVNRTVFSFTNKDEILKAYFMSTGLGWLATKMDGEVILADQNFCENIGYRQDELTGKSIKEIISTDYISEISAILADRSSKPLDGNMMFVKKDKSRQSGSYKTTIITLEKKPLRFWLLNDCRIGDNNCLENLLWDGKTGKDVYEKSKILNGIVNNLPVIIFKINDSGEFTLLLGEGSRVEKFKKSRTAKLSIKLALKQARKKLQQNTSHDDYFSFKSNFASNDEEWHFENFVFRETIEGNIYAGFSIDVTEWKNAEHELKRNTKNLQKINKELDQFAYIVSHDLKAPLRAINNLSEWIEEDLGESASSDIKTNLNLLRGRTHRLQALVDGILEYSRIGKIHLKTDLVDTDKLLQDLMDNLDVPRNFKIIKKNKLPVIPVNRFRIEQVFMNLIGNAIKYHDKESGIIEIDYEKTNDFHQFSVADDGPGIALEFHEKVFMIFQTLQPRDTVESTGVGLSIVKKIIDEIGGKVWIESLPGKGAKFIFNIPANDG
jgi:PAS domain S-box-containing protein